MDRHGFRITVEPGAILGFALLYFLDGCGWIAPWLAAAAVHELGHLLLLYVCNTRLKCLRIGLWGAEIHYSGTLDGITGALCVAAGPLFGLAYGLLSYKNAAAFLCRSGEISLILTAFNLLPILPLDGGRLLTMLLHERKAAAVSGVTAALFEGLGLWLALRFDVWMPLLMGLWLLVYNFRASSACFFPKTGIK